MKKNLMLLITQIIATGCFFSDVPENTVNKDSSPQRIGLPSTSGVEEDLIRLKAKIKNLEDKTINDLNANLQKSNLNIQSNTNTANEFRKIVNNSKDDVKNLRDNMDNDFQAVHLEIQNTGGELKRFKMETSNTLQNNNEKIIANETKINSAENDLFHLKHSKKHELNFPSGVCSNRELLQVHLDSGEIKVKNPILQVGGYNLDQFKISFKGGTEIDNPFGVATTPHDLENWVITAKVYVNNVLVHTIEDQPMNEDIQLNDLQIKVFSPKTISVTIEYGVGQTYPVRTYADDDVRLSTAERRIATGHWDNCKDDEEAIFKTKKYASISFQQTGSIQDRP